MLHNIFTKEVGKIFSRSVHSVVDIKKTNPKVYKIFPSPPKQDKYFYREELLKVDYFEKKDVPIEKVLQEKTLPNDEKLFECKLLGYEKNVRSS